MKGWRDARNTVALALAVETIARLVWIASATAWARHTTDVSLPITFDVWFFASHAAPAVPPFGLSMAGQTDSALVGACYLLAGGVVAAGCSLAREREKVSWL